MINIFSSILNTVNLQWKISFDHSIIYERIYPKGGKLKDFKSCVMFSFSYVDSCLGRYIP